MKFLALFLFIAVASAGSAPFDPELNEHWENFKTAFDKHYKEREEVARRLIWEQNVAEIVKHNLQADMGMHRYRMGLNEYADMSHEEFVKHFNGLKRFSNRKSNATTFLEPSNVQIPDTVDWRRRGLVTPIKNQRQCGSCWAFSTTGSLEGQHKKRTGTLVSLSEQNLMDCSKPEGNNGCEGGWMDYAFEYIKQNKGVDTEDTYPYIAQDRNQCLFKQSNIGATITGYVDIPRGDEQALQKAVATIGPISVAIDASRNSFHVYREGIYDDQQCSTTNLDHAVLAIGYGTEDGTDYWLVKNSWGTTWGMKGYIKMLRNQGNRCGIASKASYPLV